MQETLGAPFLPDGVRAQFWRRRDRRRFVQAPSRHREFVVLLCLKGEIDYYVDGQVVHLCPCDLLIASPGMAHFLMGETEGADLYVAVIAPELLAGAPTHPEQASGATLSPLSRHPFDMALSLAAELTRLSDQIALEIGVSWWLARLWAELQNAHARDNARLPVPLRAAIELIHDDPTLRIVDVANLVSVTPARLGQLFKAELGVTASHFRLLQRFARFDSLISEQAEPNLLSAALDAGFGDYSSFYRAHRKHRGCAPGAAQGFLDKPAPI